MYAYISIHLLIYVHNTGLVLLKSKCVEILAYKQSAKQHSVAVVLWL